MFKVSKERPLNTKKAEGLTSPGRLLLLPISRVSRVRNPSYTKNGTGFRVAESNAEKKFDLDQNLLTIQTEKRVKPR